MLGQQRACALALCERIRVNIGLCVAADPAFGRDGRRDRDRDRAAVESISSVHGAETRLGFHVFIWGRAAQDAETRPCTARSNRSFASNGVRSLSLRRSRDAWRALATRAIEPNVFYEPAFALAAQPVFGSAMPAPA